MHAAHGNRVDQFITGYTVTGSCGGAFSADAFNPSSQTNGTRIIFRNSTLARNTATQCQDVGGLGVNYPTAPSGHNVINGSLVFASSILGGRQATSNPVDLVNTSDPQQSHHHQHADRKQRQLTQRPMRVKRQYLQCRRQT